MGKFYRVIPASVVDNPMAFCCFLVLTSQNLSHFLLLFSASSSLIPFLVFQKPSW